MHAKQLLPSHCPPRLTSFFHLPRIFFADLVGFTKWSSSREPTHVFRLLETVYAAFDKIAERRGVFKIEVGIVSSHMKPSLSMAWLCTYPPFVVVVVLMLSRLLVTAMWPFVACPNPIPTTMWPWQGLHVIVWLVWNSPLVAWWTNWGRIPPSYPFASGCIRAPSRRASCEVVVLVSSCK